MRPILRGGFARVLFEDRVTGAASGVSEKVVDDDDTVITLAAGIEIGQDHNNLLIDFGFDSGLEVTTSSGTTAKFDLSSFHVGYVHRF